MTIDQPPQIVRTVEREMTRTFLHLTSPHPGECLACYLWRMLEFQCLGPRFIERYQELAAPRATALRQRLGARGGWCDCEVFLNVYEPCPQYWDRPPPEVVDGVEYDDPFDWEYPDEMPDCLTVRRGSTQPCGLWRRQR